MICQTSTSQDSPAVVLNITTADLERIDSWWYRPLYAVRDGHIDCYDARGAVSPGPGAGGCTAPLGSPGWYEAAVERLHGMLDLPENWDGYGSPRPSDAVVSAIEQALALLRDVVPLDLPTPFVCPVAPAGIQLEWTSGERHVEFTFVSPSRVIFLTEDLTCRDVDDSMDAGEFETSDGLAEFQRKLLWFGY